MIGWLTAGAIVVVAAAIVWLARMYSRLSRREETVEHTRATLQKLGGALGIERYEERTLFGARVHRLRGTFNEIDVDLEIQVGPHSSYLRLTMAFPKSLGHDFRLMSPRNLGPSNWLLRLERCEFETDEGAGFDLLTRQNERVDQMLSKSVLYQIHRLLQKVDDVRIGDETVFVMCRDAPPPDALKSIVTKSIEMAERIYNTARQIGPAPSKVDASVYEEATTGMFQRVGSDSSQAADTTGQFPVDTSKNQQISDTQNNESV